MKLFIIKQNLDKLASQLSDSDHDLMKMADQTDNSQALEVVANALFHAAELIKHASQEIEQLSNQSDSQIDLQSIKEMTAIAEEFDKSGDPLLQKQSLVLDQILNSLASDQSIKLARPTEELYDLSKKMKEYFGADKMAKAVKEQIKEYRPLESSLNTRTCPDHPGAQIQRLDDQKYQCSLDGKIYDFREGYTTIKGNKVPGGQVEKQTETMNENMSRDISFSTRDDLMKGA